MTTIFSEFRRKMRKADDMSEDRAYNESVRRAISPGGRGRKKTNAGTDTYTTYGPVVFPKNPKRKKPTVRRIPYINE